MNDYKQDLLSIFTIIMSLTFVGCAHTQVVDASKAKVWGYVELEPKIGAPAAGNSSSQYADRRYKDAVVLDYQSYDDTYVYELREAKQVKSAKLDQLIQYSLANKTKSNPLFYMVNKHSSLLIHNTTDSPIFITSPQANIIQKVKANAVFNTKLHELGDYFFYTVDHPQNPFAHVMVVPGYFSKVSQTGRWEIITEPGETRLQGVHPRLPSGIYKVHLPKGSNTEVNVTFGVDQLKIAP